MKKLLILVIILGLAVTVALARSPKVASDLAQGQGFSDAAPAGESTTIAIQGEN